MEVRLVFYEGPNCVSTEKSFWILLISYRLYGLAVIYLFFISLAKVLDRQLFVGIIDGFDLSKMIKGILWVSEAYSSHASIFCASYFTRKRRMFFLS